MQSVKLIFGGLCCIAILASCGKSQAALVVVEAGGRVRVDIDPRNSPGNAQYFWKASIGRFEPQASSSPSSYYVAPQTLAPEPERFKVVTFSVDVKTGGAEFLDYASGSLKVVEQNLFSPPTSAPTEKNASIPPGPQASGSRGGVHEQEHKPAAAVSSGDAASPPPTVSAASASSLHITIDKLPPAGEGGDDTSEAIEGKVTGGSDLSDLRIVLYAHVKANSLWYVQPLIDAPFTRIAKDGTWSSWTHSGDIYAALVVRRSFQPHGVTQMDPCDIEGVITCLPEPGGPPRSGQKSEKNK